MKLALSPTATLYHADCREALRLLPDNSIDSVCTDPPYALTQASRNGSPRNNDPETPFGRTKLGERGFMGKTWDTGEVAFNAAFWAEVLRVLKPGGHVAAFGASRGYHRMACAIEDAGFEIRDSLMWLYGTGFPKSQNVSLAMDKQAGVIGNRGAGFNAAGQDRQLNEHKELRSDHPDYSPYAPTTAGAIEFDGFGTALKPAFEPIVLARKPLSESTVAANVLRWRTGALNIGACRVGTEGGTRKEPSDIKSETTSVGVEISADAGSLVPGMGRWPANVVHDGSEEVVGAFPNTTSGVFTRRKTTIKGDNGNSFNNVATDYEVTGSKGGDSGSAARFFYSAKASKADRNGSKHPTVKPISLMEWLATLITPPGGTILDPFAGSGTTGKAAQNKGFRCILVERETEYVADIRARFAPALAPCPVVAPCPVPA